MIKREKGLWYLMLNIVFLVITEFVSNEFHVLERKLDLMI